MLLKDDLSVIPESHRPVCPYSFVVPRGRTNRKTSFRVSPPSFYWKSKFPTRRPAFLGSGNQYSHRLVLGFECSGVWAFPHNFAVPFAKNRVEHLLEIGSGASVRRNSESGKSGGRDKSFLHPWGSLSMWRELFFDTLSSPSIGLSPAARPPEGSWLLSFAARVCLPGTYRFVS